MQDKSTKTTLTTQLPAGVGLDDHNIEFVGCKTTKTVIWLQRGNSHSFNYLPRPIYKALEELFLTDHDALKVLTENFPEDAHELARMVEIYTYYMYGDLDATPDVIDGQLQPSENYREKKDCISLQFFNKNIDIDGQPLNARSIAILDDMAEGIPDKLIAHKLGITLSTLDFHKRRLFKTMNVQSKPEAISKAYKQHVLCAL